MHTSAGNHHEQPAHAILGEPIPLSYEQAVTYQVALLSKIFKEIVLLFEQEDAIAVQFEGSPDVLNKKDYPSGHAIFKTFLRTNHTFHRRYKIPFHSMVGKQILRDPLTYAEEIDPKRNSVIKPTKDSPQCFRYAVLANEAHIGDIFIIPVLALRTAGQAYLDGKTTVAFEAIVVASDSSSNRMKRNKKKLPNDIIVIDTLYDTTQEDDDDIIGFSVATGRELRSPQNSQEIGQYFTDIIDEWIADHDRLIKQKHKKKTTLFF